MLISFESWKSERKVYCADLNRRTDRLVFNQNELYLFIIFYKIIWMRVVCVVVCSSIKMRSEIFYPDLNNAVHHSDNNAMTRARSRCFFRVFRREPAAVVLSLGEERGDGDVRVSKKKKNFQKNACSRRTRSSRGFERSTIITLRHCCTVHVRCQIRSNFTFPPRALQFNLE